MRVQEIALVIIIFLVGIIMFKSCGKREVEKKLARYQDMLENQEDSTRHYRDVYGKEHAVTQKLYVENFLVRQNLKEIAYELKIKPKQIKSAGRITNSIDTFFVVDSFYSDPDIQIVRSHDTINIKLNDTLKIYEYWKRKWFFASKRTFIDVSNTNHYIKVKDINMYAIKPKTPKILIGPSIQYSPLTNNISFGVSILYYPITLKL
jgi:hypothetical protein